MPSADLKADLEIFTLLKRFADRKLPLPENVFHLSSFLTNYGIPTMSMLPESGCPYDKLHRCLNNLFHRGWIMKHVTTNGHCLWWPREVPPAELKPAPRKRFLKTVPAGKSSKRKS